MTFFDQNLRLEAKQPICLWGLPGDDPEIIFMETPKCIHPMQELFLVVR